MSEPIYTPELPVFAADVPDTGFAHPAEPSADARPVDSETENSSFESGVNAAGVPATQVELESAKKKTRSTKAGETNKASVKNRDAEEEPPPIAGEAGSSPHDAPLPDSPGEIPDKLYFRIGEVARLAGIKPYVLRFWESEFSTLGPKKSGTGHRLYRRKDVQLVLEIKTLLYEKRFTIEGARKHLETRIKPQPVAAAKSRSKETVKKVPKGQTGFFDVPASALDSVRKELAEILKLLQA